MKKRRIKKKVIYIGIIIIAALIFLITTIKNINYKNSFEYKFKSLGYEKEQVTYILEEKDKVKLNKYLNLGYIKNLTDILKQKYFIYENLDKYIKYQKENEKKSLSDVVSIINVGSDSDWYDNAIKTDTSKDNLILVNKFHYLENNFNPNDIVSIPLSYSYSGNSIREIVNDAYVDMAEAAKKDNITLIVSSSYRTYEDQEETYANIKTSGGTKYADGIAARPGHSEHQTGLALDIFTMDSYTNNFDETDAFKWLKKNAHKYGFILRYPKDKTYITGYNYESWHYRYVGESVATKIYNSDITFDEYYAYYVR